MRRKVLQDYINQFCQNAAERPDYYDLPLLVFYGPGTCTLNVLTGESTFNGQPIPPLHVGQWYREWLELRAKQDNVDLGGIVRVEWALRLEIEEFVLVRKVTDRREWIAPRVHYTVYCTGEIATDEKVYRGSSEAMGRWGVPWNEERCGPVTDILSRPYARLETLDVRTRL